MPFHTERLTMRPVAPGDVDSFYRIYSDPDTHRFNPAGPLGSLKEAQVRMDNWLSHWQQRGFGNMAIALRNAPDEVIGYGGLSVREFAGRPVNNLGYRFATHAWGQGLATEFARFAVRYGFEICLLAGIDAAVRQHHLASQRVLQKAGLKQCGEVQDVPDAPASLMFHISRAMWLASQDTPQ